jgi:hypothetical protein
MQNLGVSNPKSEADNYKLVFQCENSELAKSKKY